MKLEAERLRRLNITHILSDYELEDEHLTFLETRNGVLVYQLENTKPRAWVEKTGFGDWQPAQILDWTPNRILVRAEGPGDLILSEVNYPGWNAHLDGEATSIYEYDGLLRSVPIPKGEHIVDFQFHPTSVYLAGVVFALTVVSSVIAGRKR
jgi:hypothetical protein